MRGIITVIGQDRVGIIAGVSGILSACNVNILDISQTTMQDLFTMMMLTDLANCNVDFDVLVQRLNELGQELGVSIRLQHEDIFNSMHRI